MKDAVATMGDVLPADSGGRDAVHVAVLSVVAQHDLHPGQDVGIDGVVSIDGGNETDYIADPIPDNGFIGIVDPFIKGIVKPGQRFWLFLYPRSITGLKHEWTHPALDEEAEGEYSSPTAKARSKKWIDDFAGQWGLRADLLIAKARDYKEYGDYFTMGGTFEGSSVPKEFWDHYDRVTGEKTADADRDNFFSCSC